MTTTLTLDSKYVTVLQALGNVEDTLKDAIRGYAMTHISERIGQIQHEILRLQSQYGLPYEQFYVDITTNEEFAMQLRETHPAWERDLNNWEYYQEELATWLGHLESILKM